MPGELWIQDNDGVWRGLTAGAVDILPTPEEPPPPPPGPTVAPTIVGIGVRKSGIAAISPAWPAGHAINDVGYMEIETAAQAIGSLPTGWAHITGSPFSTGAGGAAGSVGLAILWKRATTTDEPALSIGDSGDHQTARIIVVRGLPTTGNPWDAIASDVLATASASFTIPSVTSTVDKCLVLGLVANATKTTADQFNLPSLANGTLTGLAVVSEINTDLGTIGGGWSMVSGVKATFGAVGTITGTLKTSSKQARVAIALAPAEGTSGPPLTGLRTFVGSQGLTSTLWGFTTPADPTTPKNPTPDASITNASGTLLAQSGGQLDDATAAGACIIVRCTGGNNVTKDPDGFFSAALWKAAFDSWLAEVVAAHSGTGLTKLRTAVANGVFRGIVMLDDFVSGTTNYENNNGYRRAVNFEEIEDIGQHAKAAVPWLPLFARGTGTQLRSIATLGGTVRRFRFLDACWSQWAPRVHQGTWPTPARFWTAQVAAAAQCGLSCIGGCNMLDQGTGDTPGWGCVQGASREDRCAMSPTEVVEAGLSALANPNVYGFNVYAYTFGTPYWSLAPIQTAMREVYDASIGREDPPINIRGDLEAA